MMRRSPLILWLLFPVALLCATAASAADQSPLLSNRIIKPAVACSALADTDLSAIGGKGSKVLSATENVVNNQPVCSVTARLAPEIGVQIQLPMQSWTGRYLQIGCGGLCGQIQLEVGAASGCEPVTNGQFVIAGSDMGHQAQEVDFGKDGQKRQDFASRSVHLTAVTAKKLITTFYRQSAHYAYFSGCSDGGREALIEAQRFPHDFNGIMAGAAAMNFQTQNALYHAWMALSNTAPDGKAIVVASRLPLIHQAVLAQCDALDGQKDGLITDPQSCHFDAGVLQCSNHTGPDENCLSAAEVTAVRRFYQGPTDEKSGEKLTIGGPLPGSELAWAGVFVPQQADQPTMSQSISLSALKYMSFEKNPPQSFTLQDMRFDLATFNKLRALHTLYDATNPDLSAFYAAGGKLILWHGWADPHISPLNTLAYHLAVGSTMGDKTRERFERLYLLPGVYHCANGEGPSLLDLLTPMIGWVERGQAPGAITTYQAQPEHQNSFGQPGENKPANLAARPPETIPSGAASRPAFPYPGYAVYSGKGALSDAASYEEKTYANPHPQFDWAGKDFYQPWTAR